MDNLIRVWYILVYIMSIANFIFGVYTKNVYYVTVAIMDWLIAMSIEKWNK